MKYVLMLLAALIFSACSHKDAEHCDKCDKEAAQAVAAAATPAAPPVAEPTISKEALAKIYSVNKKSLGKACASAASAYCGKVTRDLTITEDELGCLVEKVHRSTKEALDKLDGTKCAKQIQQYTKK